MSAASATGRLRQVLIGRARPFVRPGTQSAIGKFAVEHVIAVEGQGLIGDEQGDRTVHGGPDKAVHLYAWAHYAAWRRELPGVRVLDDAGAFGENFSVEGLDESSVCIGDRWCVGSAVLEVSQGRQPCWKLNHRFGVGDMAARVQQSLRAGWYCRVLQTGTVAAGDEMLLMDRPHPGWNIARLLALIRDRTCDGAVLIEALALPLTPSWRKLFAHRIERGLAESWVRRMEG